MEQRSERDVAAAPVLGWITSGSSTGSVAARDAGIMLVGAHVVDFGATAIRKFTDIRSRKFTLSQER